MLFNSVPEIGKRWDPEEEFLPEQVIKDVEEFYKENAGKGFAAAGENHYVLYSID